MSCDRLSTHNAGNDLEAYHVVRSCCFFFQAEDGIRDSSVTGVQTCALPISRPIVPTVLSNLWQKAKPARPGLMYPSTPRTLGEPVDAYWHDRYFLEPYFVAGREIGRASCRERV